MSSASKKIQKQRAHHNPSSPEERLKKDKCTLFVGNIPVTMTNRQLESKFKEFGKIESSRFRSCPVKEKYQGGGKKFGVMRKDYMGGVKEEGLSQNAYIVFAEASSVKAAVESKLFGTDIFGTGHLVRLDYCVKSEDSSSKGAVKMFDRKKSVYIPCVPSLATEKDITSAVESAEVSLAGTVRGVRIVRTNSSGNFAYVLFSERVHATTASKSGKQVDLMGTKLRFERVKKEDEIQELKKKQLQELEKGKQQALKNTVSRMKWQTRLVKKGNPKVVTHHAMPRKERQAKMLKGADLRIKYKNAMKAVGKK